jgi:hypothetical protein
MASLHVAQRLMKELYRNSILIDAVTLLLAEGLLLEASCIVEVRLPTFHADAC